MSNWSMGSSVRATTPLTLPRAGLPRATSPDDCSSFPVGSDAHSIDRITGDINNEPAVFGDGAMDMTGASALVTRAYLPMVAIQGWRSPG
jgi:hypothetical protein